MRELREWDEDYLLSLTPEEFSDFEIKGRAACDPHLDPQCGDRLKKVLGKAVSAFANTSGGYLVLGLEDPAPGQPLKVDDGGVSLHGKGKQRYTEWLSNLIRAAVDPLPDFDIQPIVATGGQSRIGEEQAVYVVQVRGGAFEPVQSVGDRVYYGRFGANSDPLPHRFVADIFTRRRDPVVSVVFSISGRRWFEAERLPLPGRPSGQWESEVELRASFSNEGPLLANYIVCHVWVPLDVAEDWTGTAPGRIGPADDDDRYVRLAIRNTRRDVIGYEKGFMKMIPNYGPTRYEPLLPLLTASYRVLLNPKLTPNSVDPTGILCWELYADSAAPRSGTCTLADIEFSFDEGARE